MMKRGLCGMIAGLCLWQVQPATAHPHAWIDLQSKVLFDREGRITGFEVDWLFDEFYTAFVIEEYLEDGQPADRYLKEIAETNIINLREYDYFTEVHADGRNQDIGDVDKYWTGFREDRLWLRFVVPLAEPVDPKKRAVEFLNYDPTYYIEVLHVEEEPVIFGEQAPQDCRFEIVPPNPTAETVSLAFSFDFMQRDTDGLGIYFAEKVAIDCR